MGATASQQTRWRLEESSSSWRAVGVDCPAAEETPACGQSCFARSGDANPSASQAGSWIGIVLEAQCRHHPAPTLDFFSCHFALLQPPAQQLPTTHAFTVSTLTALHTTRRLSLSCARLPLRRAQPPRGMPLMPPSDNSAPDQISRGRTTPRTAYRSNAKAI